MFHNVENFRPSSMLEEPLRKVLTIQNQYVQEQLKTWQPDSKSQHHVSEEALQAILKENIDISDIRTAPHISNCQAFNHHNDLSVEVQELEQFKNHLDKTISSVLPEIFGRDDLIAIPSGHFWYPEGGYMGWHTNSLNPGWRMYLNVADEAGKSFFRYRDQNTGKIMTSIDAKWNLRIFRLTDSDPLWHSVYSETNRYSFGYQIRKKPSFIKRLKKKVF